MDQLLLSRQSLSPLYGRMLNWGPNGAARAARRERGIGRASIDFGTTTDSYELQYARRLHGDGQSRSRSGSATGRRSRTSCSPSAPPETTPAAGRRGRALPGAGAAGGARRRRPRGGADSTRRSTSGSPGRCEPGQYLIGRAELAAAARALELARGDRAGRQRRRGPAARHRAGGAARGPRSPSATWRSACEAASAAGSHAGRRTGPAHALRPVPGAERGRSCTTRPQARRRGRSTATRSRSIRLKGDRPHPSAGRSVTLGVRRARRPAAGPGAPDAAAAASSSRGATWSRCGSGARAGPRSPAARRSG